MSAAAESWPWSGLRYLVPFPEAPLLEREPGTEGGTAIVFLKRMEKHSGPKSYSGFKATALSIVLTTVFGFSLQVMARPNAPGVDAALSSLLNKVQLLQHTDLDLLRRIPSLYEHCTPLASNPDFCYLKESDLYSGGRSDYALLFRGEDIHAAPGVAPATYFLRENSFFCAGNCSFDSISQKMYEITQPLAGTLWSNCAHREVLTGTNFDTARGTWQINANGTSIHCPSGSLFTLPAPQSNTLQVVINNHIGGINAITASNQNSRVSFDPFVSFSVLPRIAFNYALLPQRTGGSGRLIILSVPVQRLESSDGCQSSWMRRSGEIMQFYNCGAFMAELELDVMFAVNPTDIKDVLLVPTDFRL